VLRITDLESGKSVDLSVRELAAECLREQIDRGKKPKNLERFVERFAYHLELAIGDAVDPTLQPPLSNEVTLATYIAMMKNIPIPSICLRRRIELLKFLQENPESELFAPSAIGESESEK
jgi:hypothetical protein